MMKTIKNVADEIGISKQKLYRYIKANYINEVHYDANVIYIDDVLESKLKQHFIYNDTNHNTNQSTSIDVELIQALNDMISQLKEQIKEKDKQLEVNQELLKNQQILTLQANQKIELLEHQEEQKDEYVKTLFGLYKKVK